MKLKIITDAVCRIKNAHLKGRESTGKAACGVIIIDERGKEHYFSKPLGKMTPPQAEFQGLIFGLEKILSFYQNPIEIEIEVFMDSQLVISWLNRVYRVKKTHIKPLFEKVKELERKFKKVIYFYHSRELPLAQKADQLANSVIL